MLEPGTAAPPFAMLDQDGVEVTLADYAGRWVVLWWFAKAETGG